MCVLLLSNKETGFTSEDEEIVKVKIDKFKKEIIIKQL